MAASEDRDRAVQASQQFKASEQSDFYGALGEKTCDVPDTESSIPVAKVELSLPDNALVFMASGQGSQKPGMGADLLDMPEVAATFELASDVLGRNLKVLVTEASADELNETRNAQAAIMALSVGIGRALMTCGIVPAAVLGFSLGQISALALSGMVDDATAFEIVDQRSSFMARAAEGNPGVMSAFLKGDAAEVEAVVDENAQGDVLVLANYNCPGQIVIAGNPDAVERAEAAWSAKGYRYSRLATAGAFHSPLMAEAVEPFADYLATVEFQDPAIPLINNVDAAMLTADTVREALAAHLVNPVLFQQSVLALKEAGAREFAEVGFGGVLSGLVKRIDKDLARACIQDKASFDAFVAAHGK